MGEAQPDRGCAQAAQPSARPGGRPADSEPLPSHTLPLPQPSSRDLSLSFGLGFFF